MTGCCVAEGLAFILKGGLSHVGQSQDWACLTCGNSGGRGGGINWEIGIDIFTLPCVKQIASGRLLHSTGSSARCSVMVTKGGMGRG